MSKRMNRRPHALAAAAEMQSGAALRVFPLDGRTNEPLAKRAEA